MAVTKKRKEEIKKYYRERMAELRKALTDGEIELSEAKPQLSALEKMMKLDYEAHDILGVEADSRQLLEKEKLKLAVIKASGK